MGLHKKYEAFNQEIYERFFMPYLDSYSNVASILANISEIQDSEFLKDACAFIRDCDWRVLCTTRSNGIPSYLGIIAIQLLAAAERTNDALCTTKAYNPRLRKLLSIDSENDLQQKYRSAQEYIYELFEQWCKKRLYSIYLSKQSSNRRFVQFPLSLALLHKRDLESLSYFFYRCNLQAGDEIDFYLFKQLIETHSSYLPASVYNKLRQVVDLDRKQALCKQIYSAFLSWDGSYEENRKRYISKRSQIKEYSMYWLGDSSTPPQLFCDDDEMSYYDVLREFPQGCFFDRDPLRRNDWIRISEHNLRSDQESAYAWVVGNTRFINNVKQYLGVPQYDYGNGAFKIFIISSQEINLLAKYFPDRFGNNSQEPFVKLIGGLKIGPRKWLTGAGPIISAEGSIGTTAHLINYKNNEKTIVNITDQPLIDLPSGRYLLRYSPEAPAILFTISPAYQEETVQIGGGWIINNAGMYLTTTSENEFQLQGLDFSNFPISKNADFIPTGNTLQQWMCLAVGKKNVEISNENIVHKALRRKLYGIRNR